MPQSKWLTWPEWGREMERERVRDRDIEEEQVSANHSSSEGIRLDRAGFGLGCAILYHTLQHHTTLKYTIPCFILQIFINLEPWLNFNIFLKEGLWLKMKFSGKAYIGPLSLKKMVRNILGPFFIVPQSYLPSFLNFGLLWPSFFGHIFLELGVPTYISFPLNFHFES